MERLSAVEVLERTIAIIPWVAERRGGYATFDEIAERFGMTTADAYKCLEVAGMVGVAPYTPDTLIEIFVEPDGVTVQLPEYFRRPLRPSPEQTFLLLTAATVLTGMEGASASGALRSAIAKITAALGDGVAAIDLELDPPAQGLLPDLREAIEARLSVDIDHYSFGSDEVTSRRVDPWRLQQSGGHWYLQAWCHERSDERVFRLDRIRSAIVTDSRFIRPEPLPPFEVFSADRTTDRVRLRLGVEGRWVTEYYPCDAIETAPDGTTDVVLAIGSAPWLERLLLRLGPEVEVLDAPPHLESLQRVAARRLLDRYRK